MTRLIKFSMMMAGIAVLLFQGCKEDDPAPKEPTVTTAALTNITTSSATAGGTITSAGGATITASGVVWSNTSDTPTTADNVENSGTTAGSFIVNLSDLDFGTTYYVRAFATNKVGTGYGDVVTLNTTNDTTKVRFTYNGQQVVYGVITSPTTGKKWMDRNLGASQTASASNDTASYGHLFQWGRGVDGHQLRTSGSTTTLSSTDNPGHSLFIISNNGAGGDWRSPQNAGLWQGSSGINNPCPSGWHVPTKVEWVAETGITNSNTAYAQLKLPTAGYRWLNGNFYGAGSGYFWTSTPDASPGTLSYVLSFNASSIFNNSLTDRGQAFSIRCIKD